MKHQVVPRATLSSIIRRHAWSTGIFASVLLVNTDGAVYLFAQMTHHSPLTQEVWLQFYDNEDRAKSELFAGLFYLSREDFKELLDKAQRSFGDDHWMTKVVAAELAEVEQYCSWSDEKQAQLKGIFAEIAELDTFAFPVCDTTGRAEKILDKLDALGVPDGWVRYMALYYGAGTKYPGSDAHLRLLLRQLEMIERQAGKYSGPYLVKLAQYLRAVTEGEQWLSAGKLLDEAVPQAYAYWKNYPLDPAAYSALLGLVEWEARYLLMIKETDKALRLIEQADALFGTGDEPVAFPGVKEFLLLQLKAKVLIQRGELRQARIKLNEVLSFLRRNEDKLDKSQVNQAAIFIGECLVLLGDKWELRSYLDSVSRTVGGKLIRGRDDRLFLRARAMVAGFEENDNEADSLLQEYFDLRHSHFTNDHPDDLPLLEMWAKVKERLGKKDDALRVRDRVERLKNQMSECKQSYQHAAKTLEVLGK
ncbi:MAG: hypothetical protein KatS3mg109_2105 [Pirellulaceae bacterium]|nr:MAG: hypothetical protein KatS3mg109_2105 [Pirellulaceae bacterium]